MGLGSLVWALWAFAREPRAPARARRCGSTGELGVPCYLYLHGRWASLFIVVFCVRGLGRLVLVRPAGLPGPVGFVLWAPGSSVWSCLQVLFLVLRVLARGPNSVHSSIRCTSTPQGCDPVALVLERMRVVAGGKKR